MARRSKPWQRKGRGWFVTINGKQIPLGKDKKAAFERFHELMSRPREQLNSDDLMLLGVLDDFLEWNRTNRTNRAPATYQSYKEKLQSLIDSLPQELLKPYHIQKWLDANPQWQAQPGTRTSLLRNEPSTGP